MIGHDRLDGFVRPPEHVVKMEKAIRKRRFWRKVWKVVKRYAAWAVLVGLVLVMLSACSSVPDEEPAAPLADDTPTIDIDINTSRAAVRGGDPPTANESASEGVAGSDVASSSGGGSAAVSPPTNLDPTSTVMRLAALVDALGDMADADEDSLPLYRLAVEILEEVIDLAERGEVALRLVEQLDETLRSWPGRPQPQTRESDEPVEALPAYEDHRDQNIQDTTARAEAAFAELAGGD